MSIMEPLSKAKLKLYASLKQKKFRYAHRLFVVEGEKMVQEALRSGWKVECVVMRDDFVGKAQASGRESQQIEEWGGQFQAAQTFQADKEAFKRISSQTNPEGVLAILPFPEAPAFNDFDSPKEVPTPPKKSFLLEGIQDPGNMGTILRIADWFGFEGVVCSEGTVDIWNPKVLRASMGAIFRVKVWYVANFDQWVAQLCAEWVAADMQGEDVRDLDLTSVDHILLGNEANGVSSSIRELPNARFVTIKGAGGAESLNVGVAAGILAFEATQWDIKGKKSWSF